MIKFRSTTAFSTAALSVLVFAYPPGVAISGPTSFHVTSDGSQVAILQGNQVYSRQITGLAGGSLDTTGCGWIDKAPNHTFSITSPDIISMTFSVTGNNNAQFTLMIKNAADPEAVPFCAIADPFTGIPAEISGVWDQGKYEVYVGNFESQGERQSYVLDID